MKITVHLGPVMAAGGDGTGGRERLLGASRVRQIRARLAGLARPVW